MNAAAPEIFQTLEASQFAAFVRQTVWLYPLANILHVAFVMIFAGALAAMDVRLMGGFAGSSVADVLRGGRKVAVEAFGGILVTGAILFSAEASHLALNPVFQTKMLLIGLAFLNILVFELAFARRVREHAPRMPMPMVARASGFASLATWLAVAVCGRSIAYF
ncbi:MAG TPA: hypothetical protein VFQ27_07720 [Xanthobacteraceae bacterium]|nr:hypothetical protein [Xanthobacteraceae bacterium]